MSDIIGIGGRFDRNPQWEQLERWTSTYGEERYEENEGILAGFLGGGGKFSFAGRENVPSLMWGVPFPRYTFTGTEGHFWYAPLWLFGHVSSDSSDTFWLLWGLIPIRYNNSEKLGTL